MVLRKMAGRPDVLVQWSKPRESQQINLVNIYRWIKGDERPSPSGVRISHYHVRRNKCAFRHRRIGRSASGAAPQRRPVMIRLPAWSFSQDKPANPVEADHKSKEVMLKQGTERAMQKQVTIISRGQTGS
jgi:hypothetical protein